MRSRSSAWRPDMAAAVTISSQHPVALAVVAAIHVGDLAAVRRLLAENPWLPTARLGDDDPEGMSRTLLHVVTDWPGHFPNGAATVAVLVAAGADPNARFTGPHAETHCNGPRAATTSKYSTRSSTRVPTSKQPARSSPAAPRSP